ncbi:hypothetical protein N2152v2_003888 [Parachlorella kessleri]
MMRGLLLACLCLSTVALCTGTRVWVTDHGGNVLASDSQQLTAMGLAATLTTLAGSTGLTVDSAAAAEVSSLLQGGMLSRPEAVLAIHIVGADAGAADLPGWTVHDVAPCCNSNRVAQQLALAVGHASMVTCGEQCVEEGLQELASLIPGASYTPAGQPAAGRLSLPAGPVAGAGGAEEMAAPVVLDLGGSGGAGLEGRVWATELATMLREAQQAAGGSPGPYAWTLVGLQALQLKHGASTSLFLAAQSATLAAAARVDGLLAARSRGSLVSVVAVSPPVDLPGTPSLKALLRWKAQLELRRSSARLLAEEPAPYAMSSPASLYYKSDSNSTSAEDLHNMTVKASAWTLGIMLLITLYGAVYCMFGMDFKRDTLLFGAPKTRAD